MRKKRREGKPALGLPKEMATASRLKEHQKERGRGERDLLSRNAAGAPGVGGMGKGGKRVQVFLGRAS